MDDRGDRWAWGHGASWGIICDKEMAGEANEYACLTQIQDKTRNTAQREL